MSTDALALGVDIGGTKIAFAAANREGRILTEHRIPTAPEQGVSAVLDRVAGGIQHILSQINRPVQGIGVGSPGLVNPVTGTCQHAVNLGWKHVALRDELQQRLQIDVPIFVQRDTNAGTVGEWIFGAARGEQNFVYIGIGTGLGLGAVSDNKLLLGSAFMAMEFGHISLDPRGRRCTCGIRGCGEIYVSGMGLMAGYQEHRQEYPESRLARQTNATVNDIVSALHQGDPLARVIGEEAADKLASVIACCVGTIDPGRFVIGVWQARKSEAVTKKKSASKWFLKAEKYGLPLAVGFLVAYPIFILVTIGPSGAIKWIDNFGIQILIYIMLGWGLNIVVGLAGLRGLGNVAVYAVGPES
jgi:glucokinase